jgi:hypothetical protein
MARGKAMTKARAWEIDVDREALRDHADRALVRGVRLAQVPLEHVAHPDEVLLDEGLVEAELMVDDGHVAGRGVGAEDGVGRVAGQQVDQKERGHRHEEDDDDEQHHSLGDVPAHV